MSPIHELIQRLIFVNAGICTASHLIRSGAEAGFTEEELRTAAKELGVIGRDAGKWRLLAFKEDKDFLELMAQITQDHWAVNQREAELAMAMAKDPDPDDWGKFLDLMKEV